MRTAASAIDEGETTQYGQVIGYEDLMTAIQTGDERALAQLYVRYRGRVYALARRITGDWSTAEEVVQDTFLGLWRSAASFRADADLEAWLMSIAWHRAIDATRAGVFRARARERALADHEFPSDGGINRVESNVQLIELVQLVRVAQPMTNRILMLAYVERCSHQQIAAATGLSLGTIKGSIRRALHCLRTHPDVLPHANGAHAQHAAVSQVC